MMDLEAMNKILDGMTAGPQKDELSQQVLNFMLNGNVANDTPVAASVIDAETPIQDDISDYVFVSGENLFINKVSKSALKKDAFNTALMRQVPPDVKMAASTYAVKTLDVPIAFRQMFYPLSDQQLITYQGETYFNTYDPMNLPEVPDDWETHDAWKVCEKHIHNSIEEGAEEIIKWMAHNVQFPGRKILWSPLEFGPEGSGKSTKGQMIKSCFGNRYVSEIDMTALNDNFTDWAEGACVGMLEEIKPVGQNRHVIVNKLKPFISNNMVSIRPHGLPKKTVPNFMNYMAFTNYSDALALSEGDRRWFVVSCPWGNKQEMVDATVGADPDYWTKLHDAYQQHPGVVRGWLLNVDLSDFNINQPPANTAAKQVMVNSSKPDAQVWIEEILEFQEDFYGIDSKLISSRHLTGAVKEQFNKTIPPRLISSALETLGFHKHERKAKLGGVSTILYADDATTAVLNGGKGPTEVAKSIFGEAFSADF